MTKFLHQVPHIRQSLERLICKHSDLQQYPIDLDRFQWPHYQGGFEGLVRIVIGQQISTDAASALWKKLCDQINPLTPEQMLNQDDDTLKDLGLSRQKKSYVKGLATSILEGKFCIDTLDDQDDDRIYEMITEQKGFGDWSANIYLLFCLARPDIWPSGDLGIQLGLQKYLGLSEKPDVNATREYGQMFKPDRSAASLLMWHIKSLP